MRGPKSPTTGCPKERSGGSLQPSRIVHAGMERSDIACTKCSPQGRTGGCEQLDMILLPFAGQMKVLSPAPLIERMNAKGDALKRDHPVP